MVAAKLLDDKDFIFDSDLALFLSAPISLDSYNFEPSLFGSKWTNVDKEIFERLQEFNLDLKQNPKEYAESLLRSKQDIKKNLELGCKENLIKDFKQYDLI